jgi:uncharacterized SAM-binding protein YcdF (DUF218 family)
MITAGKLISTLRIRQVIPIFILVFLVWIGFSGYSIAAYANYSNETPADGIVVLGAAVWGNQPSPVFRERINHAIQLYQDGYAPIIIFTGGKGDSKESAESEVATQYAVKHGVRANDILVETLSTTTEQNLYYARELAMEHNLTSLIIVSDPLHMKRAMLIAEDMGLRAHSSPTRTTRYTGLVEKLKFLARETYYYQRYLLRRSFYRFSPEGAA